MSSSADVPLSDKYRTMRRGSWAEATRCNIPGANLRYYVSDLHGVRAILADTDEPIAQLHIVLATEADTNDWSHKHDGLPHTLEHAIFLGSQQYPLKGVLDKLANRSLADGTNAWTSTDHTAYTMESAGYEGLLNLLPIYIDHILNPTLTDECFTTEVHHVTGEGEDKGVVYCEMQARENDASSLVDLALMQLLFPSGGYSAETGGILSNLRDLTNEQVQRYHKEYYRPSNVLIVLSGLGVDEQAFVEALGKCETRIAAGCDMIALLEGKAPPEPPRPWSGPVCRMNDGSGGDDGPEDGILLECGTKGVAKSISFPSDDETVGTASMAWRGPLFEDRDTFLRLQLLWKYLTDSAASPLQKAFVECNEPICGEVSPADEMHKLSYLQVWFEDCEVAEMGSIPQRFFKAVQEARDDFDVERMRTTLDRFRRERVVELENEPTNAIIDQVIQHFLYAQIPTKETRKDGAAMNEVSETMRLHLDPLLNLKQMMEMAASDWQGLIDTWILQPPCAVVLGYPSPKMVKDLSEADEARTKERKETLGDEWLKAKADALSAAQVKNAREIPASTLQEVPIPSISSVKMIGSFAVCGGGEVAFEAVRGSDRCDDFDEAMSAKLLGELNQGRLKTLKDSPHGGSCWLECIQIDSAFLQLAVAFDTTALPPGLRLYVPLLLELFFKADAILESGERMSKDSFVDALEAETVDYDAENGPLGGRHKQLLCASVRVENTSAGDGTAEGGMECALKWLRRALFCTQYKVKNVRTCAKRLASGCPANFRDGSGINKWVWDSLTSEIAKSTTSATSPMMQLPFLQCLIKRLDDEHGQRHVLSQLEALRSALIRPWRMQALVAGNLANVDQIYEQVVQALTPPTNRVAPVDLAEEEEDEGTDDGEDEEDEEGEDDEGEDQQCGDAEEDEEETEKDGKEQNADDKDGARAKAKGTIGPLIELIKEEAEETEQFTQADDEKPLNGAAPVRDVARKHIMRPEALTDGTNSTVVGLSAIESNFLTLQVPGVGSYHEDICALRVVIEYLTALEGDFWVKLRGAGLTYSYTLKNHPDAETISFSLSKCTDAIGAYKESKEIISEYASGKKVISELELDAAKSTLTYSLISQRSKKEQVIKRTWEESYYPVDADYFPWLLNQIQHVTVADATHALTRHLVPLFDASALLVAVCPTSKVSELAQKLEEAHQAPITAMTELQLQKAFGPRAIVAAAEKQRQHEQPQGDAEESAIVNLPVGRGRGRPAFGFAKQFKCGCPKCDPEKRADRVEVA